MTLSHLPYKDLLHATSVSKHWHSTTREFPSLERNLFLRPQRAAPDHLDWTYNLSLLSPYTPIITAQPTTKSKTIVTLHPSLKPDTFMRTYIRMHQDYNTFLITSPSMFLSQPPLKKVKIDFNDRTITLVRDKGIAFGDVRAAIDKLHSQYPGYWRALKSYLIRAGIASPAVDAVGDWWSAEATRRRYRMVGNAFDVRIDAEGVVAEVAIEVKEAREAQVRA
jgi:hypothetical protein